MTPVLTQEFALKFAIEWIEAWNSHDLNRLLRHYDPGVELTSPFVRTLLNVESNNIHGIATLKEYFSRALEVYPELRFVLRQVYAGSTSLVLEYDSVRSRLAAEFMELNAIGLVCRVCAHYSAVADPPPLKS